MKVITATMIFDSPAGPWDSDYRDGRYYAVTLDAPEGTPGAKYNERYERNEIRVTFYEDTEEEAFWKSLSRGDQVQILVQESAKARSGYSFKPIVPDDWEPKQSPQEATEQYENKTPHQPRQSPGKRFDWTNANHRQAVLAVGEFILDTVSQLVQGAQERGHEPLEAQKIGVTAFIEAKGYVRKHGADVLRAVKEATADADAEETIIRGIDPGGLPDSFLNACAIASPLIEDRNEAANILKRFGFSGADLDPEDPDGWVSLYAVARAFAYALKEEGLPEQDAVDKVIDAFNLDAVNVEPF